jgi:carboxymethylenebutenolidase
MPQDITHPAGPTETGGHLAVPEGEGPWPGVVVLAEATGLTADIRAQADRLAAAGHLALAPDLYHGRPWLRCVLGAFGDLARRRGRAGSAGAVLLLDVLAQDADRCASGGRTPLSTS